MPRHKNWQNRLTSLIDNIRHDPFDFPKHNCLLWTLAGAKAVTGVDYAKKYKGKFPDEKTAIVTIKELDGCNKTEQVLAKTFGEFKPISFARIGDIVFYSKGEFDLPADLELFGPVPGICYGGTSYFLGKQGLVEIPTLKLDKALWVS